MFRLLLILFYFNSLNAMELRIGPENQSYEHFKVQRLNTSAPTRVLNQKFIEAVKLYQSKSSHKSFRYFKEVVAEAYQYEWPEVQRQSIAYSFLRLAEQYSEKRDFFINEAKKFYDEGSLNTNSFAKRTMRDLKSRSLKTMDFPVLHFFKSPHYVSINSQRIDLKNWANLKLPEGPIRLVILSRGQQEFIYIGNTQSLLSTKISVKDLDFGTCNSPKLFDQSLRETSFRIQFHKSCSFQYKAGIFLKNNDYKVVSAPEPKFAKTYRLPKLKTQKTKAKWKHWDKIAWGVGIIASGLIYQHNNRTKKVVYTE